MATHRQDCKIAVQWYSMAFPTTSLGFHSDIIIIITLNCLHVLVLSILLIVLHCIVVFIYSAVAASMLNLLLQYTLIQCCHVLEYHL